MWSTVLRAAVGLAVLVATQHGAAADPAATSGSLGLGISGGPALPASSPAQPPLVSGLGTGSSAQPPILLVAQLPPPPAAGTPAAAVPAAGCTGPVDPYKNYTCLDAYLGSGFFERLYNYYRLEWGQAGPPTDPTAPPGRKAGWPDAPQSSPPMPFTEWPYGGTTNLGVNRTGSVDSPFMAAISNTALGQWMNNNGIQLYGWVDPGFNVSSNTVRPGGNAPVAYSYTPNTVQLDQVVLYLERTPDTVQDDHVDWGFRLSGIYGENYRYTTAYGISSYQLLKNNSVNGYDFPMVYGEMFVPGKPGVGEGGLMLRLGRFISLPDIEAQLAPNNYMYSHSMTYTFDNYTNEGLQATWGATKELFLQLGVTVGTEAAPWHLNNQIPNLMPGNPLYPGATFAKDPGAQPSVTGCVRYDWNAANDDINLCADAINRGDWGYNNLQWYGGTAYHKFNDQWHIAFEMYDEHQNGVPNANNPAATAIVAGGGTPFSPQYVPFNAPGLAFCSNPTVLRCRAESLGAVAYLNYSPDPLDNFSFRPEFYDDMEGQRTGTKARYMEIGLGWQHWLSPQIEFRPEIVYYRSFGANAFNGDSNAGIAPNKNYTVIAQSDVIIHF